MTRLTRQLLVFALASSSPVLAFADGTTTGSGTCTGMVNGKAISGKTMLALPTSQNTEEMELVTQNQGSVFGRAECDCHSRGVRLRVILDQAAAQDGQAFSTAMWVGQDNCSDQTQHTTNGAQCEQITTNNPPGNSGFKLEANSFRTVAAVDVSLPGEALTKPRPVGTSSWDYKCETGGPQNVTAQVLLGPDSAPATCKLPLTVNTLGPTAPRLDSVGSGNNALTVRWSVAESTSGIQYYQVLCRSKNAPNVPVMSDEFRSSTPYYFSACIDGMLYRRPLNSGNTNTTEERPGFGAMPAAGKFLVDPRFICSDRVTATTTDLSARIAGLNNGEEYEVMVVSIDSYGNATESAVVVGTPQPTKGVLDDLCATEANCPAGFGCSALGAMPSPSTLLPVGAFVLLLGLARRRRVG